MKKIALFLILVGCSKNITLDSIKDGTLINVNDKSSYLIQNPYKTAPLSAEFRLSKTNDEPITITVKGQDGPDSDLSYTWPIGYGKEFPILGLYFEATNTIIINTPTITKTLYLAVTNKPSEYINNITVTKNNIPKDPNRKNFLNFINPVGKLTDIFAIDDWGKIRWYFMPGEEIHGIKFKESNNQILMSYLSTTKTEVRTINLAGKNIKTIKLKDQIKNNVPEADKRFHHDMVLLNNGNIIILDKSQYGVEDLIIEIDNKGNLVREILIGDWIRQSVNGDPKDYTGLELFIFDSVNNPIDEYASDEVYPGMPKEKNAIDWAHINALSFDEQSRMLYLSFRQHGIFAFNYDTGELKWIAIRENYTMPSANRSFYNIPENMQYVYEIPKLQPYIVKFNNGFGPDHPHAVTSLGHNKIMVFDNSGNDGQTPEDGSRLLVFNVDENTKQGKIDWEYKHMLSNKQFLYSQIVSDIDRTSFDSYIGIYGTRSPFYFLEINNDKQIIFEMQLNIIAKTPGESDIALPISCPTSRLAQNGIFLYRGDYQPIYPSLFYSID